VIAEDNQLSSWQKPYLVVPRSADGAEVEMHHWDPDCFRIGDVYYAISGGPNPPLLKSDDLTNWFYVGDFLQRELPDVAIGEDISCPNFFPLGNKWMLLCISHPFGCRYYLGEWDAEAEQFVPDSHGRMNWPRPDQSIYETAYRDFFAPESVLTPDGRRVMWAWLATLHEEINLRSIQSLPRELSLAADGTLRMRPLRELQTLRYDKVTLTDITVVPPAQPHSSMVSQPVANLDGDAFEIRVTLARAEALRKRFGVQLFTDEHAQGLPILIHPESGTLRVGSTEAPFAVADLTPEEDVEIRIFVDKYLVEVFANDRQSAVAAYMDYRSPIGLNVYAYGTATTIKSIEIWKMRPTNQGYFAAEESRIWEPKFE
jgi:sucrose-6-phosphate hydrolase SacC (GH32 family)